MNTLFAILWVLICATNSYYFEPGVSWSHYYVLPTKSTLGYGAAMGLSGDICIAGSVTPGVSSSQADACMFFLNNDGDTSATRIMGGSLGDKFRAVSPTHDSGFVGAGETTGGSNSYFAKGTSTGISWTRSATWSGSDRAYGIVETSTEEFISVGEWSSNACLTKLSSSGSIQWIRSIVLGNSSTARDVKERGDGNYILTGEANVPGQSGSQSVAFAVLTDTSGMEIWRANLSSLDEDYGYVLINTSDNGALVGGLAGTADEFASGGLRTYATLYKVDSLGDIEWVKNYDETAGTVLFVEELEAGGTPHGFRFVTESLNGFTIVETDLLGNATNTQSKLFVDGVEFRGFCGLNGHIVGTGSVDVGGCSTYASHAVGAKIGTSHPQVTFSSDTLEFPVTYVGQTSTLDLVFSNSTATASQLVSIESAGAIFFATPSSFSIPAEGSITVTMSFSPTFTHDFVSTLAIRVDGIESPELILVEGTSCRQLLPPSPPHLYQCGSPNHIYFSLGWDENDRFTEYAVEISTNDFATSQYLDLPFGIRNDPAFYAADSWGIFGTGVIGSLGPATTYRVRVIARDKLGMELISQTAELITYADHFLVRPELTITVVSDSTILLHWDGEMTDTTGAELINGGWLVLSGAGLDAISDTITRTFDNFIELQIDTFVSRFFAVDRIVSNVEQGLVLKFLGRRTVAASQAKSP